MAAAAAATAVVVVVVSTEEVSAVVVSTGEASGVALSMVVGSAGEVFAVVVFTAVAFVAAVSAAVISTAVAFMVVVSITDSLMMSSSAASAFRAGGAGTIRTDITVTAITRTVTMDTVDIHMDTVGTVTTVAPVMDIAMGAERVMDMAMATEPVTDTAMVADQGIPGVRGVDDKAGYRFLMRQRRSPFRYLPRLPAMSCNSLIASSGAIQASAGCILADAQQMMFRVAV
jgi:hypothetical protein